MRHVLLLLLIALLSISCDDDIQFNLPVLQGVHGTELFRANSVAAQVDDNQELRIEGAQNDEVLQLYIQDPIVGDTIALHAGAKDFIVYQNPAGVSFSTLYNGEGFLVVDEVVDQTYSGTFVFKAESLDGVSVRFTDGVFYRIPLVGQQEEDEDPLPEQEFTAVVQGTMPFTADRIRSVVKDGRLTLIAEQDVPEALLSIDVPESIDEGSYAIPGPGRITYRAASTNTASSGILTISNHDKTSKSISGTFTFEFYVNSDTVEVTQGRFTVNY